MKEDTTSDRLLTVGEAATALALRPSTIRKLLTYGHLRRVHPTGARAVRIRLSEVTALIEHGRETNTSKAGLELEKQIPLSGPRADTLFLDSGVQNMEATDAN